MLEIKVFFWVLFFLMREISVRTQHKETFLHPLSQSSSETNFDHFVVGYKVLGEKKSFCSR
jgi:hypothetical protein